MLGFTIVLPNLQITSKICIKNLSPQRLLNRTHLDIFTMTKPKLLGMATLLAIPMTILASMPALADYAAIAYSRSTGYSGYSWKHYSASSARDVAIRSCNSRGCTVEVLVQNQCAALARKRNSYSFVTTGVDSYSRSAAGNKAMAACGNNCQLVVSVCSNVDN